MRARRCRRTLAALVAALAGSALLPGCDRLPGRPDAADRYRAPAEVRDFATLYAQNCAGCHGAAGTRGPARPLADPLYLGWIGRERLAQVVAGGVAGTAMPPFDRSAGGGLDAAQIDALVRGLYERWGATPPAAGAGLPPYAAALGDPDRGAPAYALFCARCHGDDGRGGEHGGSVVDGAFLALVSDQMLRSAVVAGRPDLDMPDWRTAADERAMTAQEIRDVVAWLAAQRVPPPGTAAVE